MDENLFDHDYVISEVLSVTHISHIQPGTVVHILHLDGNNAMTDTVGECTLVEMKMFQPSALSAPNYPIEDGVIIHLPFGLKRITLILMTESGERLTLEG